VCSTSGLASAQCLPDTGLISAWDGDAVSGSVADDLKDGNDGTFLGGVTLAQGLRGQAFSFDGATGFIDFGTGISYRSATQGAVAAWVKGTPPEAPADTDYWATIFEHDRDMYGNYAVQLVANIDSLKAEFTLFNGDYFTVYGNTPVLDGKWHQVIGQWNSEGMYLYVDGRLDNSNALVVDLGTYEGGGARSGVIYYGFEYAHWYGGLVDELQIFDRALAAADIEAAFTACRPVQTISDLIQQVAALGLSRGLKQSFLAKLGAAQRSLDNGRNGTAVEQLQAFINEVEAQRGKALTNAAADAMVSSASGLIAVIQAG
jgi:hypothetical protein